MRSVTLTFVPVSAIADEALFERLKQLDRSTE